MTSMAGTKILSVGQCGYDHGKIRGSLNRSFGAETVAAATASDAFRSLARDRFDLVLVNRIGDGDGEPGVDFIRALKADPAYSSIPVMLVSNYASAQEEAVAAGALPGFGKGELGNPAADDAIRAVLAPAAKA
jgi:two-component system chemotaxis response regulator CheY